MANQQSQLSKILQKNRIELADLQKKSSSWFRQQAMSMNSLQNKTSLSFIAGDPESKGNVILPGTMVMFLYDPKFKETLPYYDMFPLVLPFRKMDEGFLGLNLHYLPYVYRARLLDALLHYKTNENMDERTKLKFNWQVLSGASKLKAAMPCVKHYLYEHVQSPFKAIHITDWATAICLPVEQFEGASKAQVWKESIARIK